MAPVNPPAWQQAGSYSARLDRLVIGGLMTGDAQAGPLAARSGVSPTPSGAMEVRQRPTPDLWVTVRAGVVYIAATSSLGGLYQCTNDGDVDVQLATAHATLPRKDLIVARVYDAVDGTGTTNAYAIEAITGTPASSPTRPNTPSQGLALAEVLVPAATSSVTNSNITDLRDYTVAVGGILPCANASDYPPAPYMGQKVWRNDTKSEYIWDGSVWQAISYTTWGSYTPNFTASGTSPALGTGVQRSGSYTQIGKTVHARAYIVLGTSGVTAGSGTYRMSLPVAARTLSTGFHFGVGEFYDDSGNDVMDAYVRCGGSTGWSNVEFVVGGVLWTSSNPFGVQVKDSFGFSITYEAA